MQADPTWELSCLHHILVSKNSLTCWCSLCPAHFSTPTPLCHHGRGKSLRRNYLRPTHTQPGRCLQVNIVQILAQLTSKLEHADNKADPRESHSPLPWRVPGAHRGAAVGGGVREREDVWSGLWQHSTCCVFNTEQLLAICLNWPVSPDQEIRAGGGFNQEACWWGRVLVERGGGMLLCESDTPSVIPVEHSSCLWQLTRLLRDDDVSAPAGPWFTSMPVLSGMSHIDAIIRDLRPEVFLVLL